MILLCEHYQRVNQHGSAFLLSGLVVRSAQALLLDVGQDEDTNPDQPPSDLCTIRESRRRVMWSCYSMDLQMSSGVRRLITVQPENICIPLPCQERNYLLQIPCATENLVPSSSPSERAPLKLNLGLEAYYIRIVYIRGTILQQIRIRNHSPLPWQPESMFIKLTEDLATWEADLPTDLLLTSKNIYIRREQGQLAALFGLHLMLHQCYCDLFRVSMPGFAFPMTSSFEKAPKSFWQESQDTCYHHAYKMTEILAMALKHGRTAISDSLCLISAFESVRQEMVYLVSCCPGNKRQDVWLETARGLETGLKTLRLLKDLTWVASDCVRLPHT